MGEMYQRNPNRRRDLHAGGLSPTNITATSGFGSVTDLTSAVGIPRIVTARACPAGVDSSTRQSSPYLGGENIPMTLSLTSQPALPKMASKSSANCAASASPSLVSCTFDPRKGRKEAAILSWAALLIRRCASLCCSSRRDCSASAALASCWAISPLAFARSIPSWRFPFFSSSVSCPSSVIFAVLFDSSIAARASFLLPAFMTITVNRKPRSKDTAMPQLARVITLASRSIEFQISWNHSILVCQPDQGNSSILSVGPGTLLAAIGD